MNIGSFFASALALIEGAAPDAAAKLKASGADAETALNEGLDTVAEGAANAAISSFAGPAASEVEGFADPLLEDLLTRVQSKLEAKKPSVKAAAPAASAAAAAGVYVEQPIV
jgi:hypothetical protein